MLNNMSSILRYAIVLEITLAIMYCSCSKEPNLQINDSVVINLMPTIDGDVAVTRALPTVFNDIKITPSDQSSSFDFGMWLCGQDHEQDNPYEPYADGMGNMLCNYYLSNASSPIWSFNYGGISHYILSVKPIDSTKKDIYLYAYFPFDSMAKNPESIPVHSGVNEFIYARPIHRVSKQPGDTINIPLTFHHAQACLVFNIKAAHITNDLHFTHLSIVDTEKENLLLPLYSEFNIVDGSYNDRREIKGDVLELEEFDIKIPPASENKWVQVSVPIIPFKGYKDKRFSVIFTFDKKQCTFQLPIVKEGDTTTNTDDEHMDFMPGYRYCYYLTLENEMTFISGKILNTWTSGESTNIDI